MATTRKTDKTLSTMLKVMEELGKQLPSVEKNLEDNSQIQSATLGYLLADLHKRKHKSQSIASCSTSPHIKPSQAPQNNQQPYEPQSKFGNSSIGNYKRPFTTITNSSGYWFPDSKPWRKF
jgi:hypothetical protein